MQHFQSNVQFLKRVDPDLAQAVASQENVATPAVESTKKGGITLKVGAQYVHSRYAPLAEAEKWTRGEAQSIHIHFGFGLGYGVEADCPKGDGLLLVYEPFPQLFLAALHHRSLLDIYNRKKVYVRFQLQDLAHLLVATSIKADKIAVRANPFHAKAMPDALPRLQKTVQDALLRRATSLETLRQSSRFFTDAALQGLPEVMRVPNINCLKQQYRGTPAIVVAAGPSLDRNLAWVRQAQEKALIICISRSAKPLERLGIEPDFLLHNEAQDYLHLIHDCTNLQKTTFVLDSQVHQKFARYPAKTRFLYHSIVNFGVSWLAQILPNYQPAHLETAGSVSNDAFSFAQFLGCDPIVIVGQDLALTGGAYYANAPSNQAFTHSGDSITQIDGYFGKPLKTFATYKSFALWYSDQALKRNRTGATAAINATEGGARLEGFRDMTLQQVVANMAALPKKPESLAHERFASKQHEANPQKVRTFLADALKDLNKLIKYQTHLQQLLDNKNPTAQIAQIHKLESSMQKLVAKHSVISGYIQAELQDLKARQKSSDDPLQRLQNRGESFAVIAKGALACAQTLERVLQRFS